MWSYLKKTPVVFPIVAVFFIILSVIDANLWIGDKRIDTVYWYKPLVIMVYTLFWIFVALRHRWAANAFIVYAILHYIIYLFYKDHEVLHRIVENAMVAPIPFSLLFSGIILFYYRGMK